MRLDILLILLVRIESISPFTILSERTFHKSLAGFDPDVPSKVNQDAAFSLSLDKYACCGVLDGHGKKGHELNAFLCPYIENSLREKLQTYPNPTSSVSTILLNTFEEAQLAAQLEKNVPAARSGTTCVISVLDKTTGMVYTANVGDSRAIIGIKISSTMGDKWHIEALSTETTTSIPEERARIEQGEGRIDAGGNVWYGPVAIAMTRSLGNSVMKRANILSTPIITTYRIVKDDVYDSTHEGECMIVTGTDGIFDVLNNEAVIHLLAANSDKKEDVCNNLILEARNNWQQDLPMDVRIDDTSCAVIATSFMY